MSSIKIGRSELINGIASLLKRAGSTEWSLYVNTNGDVDVRHNTHFNRDWFKIVDAYGMDNYEDDNKYPGDEGYDYQGAAEWIANEETWIPAEVIYYDNDLNELCAELEVVY